MAQLEGPPRKKFRGGSSPSASASLERGESSRLASLQGNGSFFTSKVREGQGLMAPTSPSRDSDIPRSSAFFLAESHSFTVSDSTFHNTNRDYIRESRAATVENEGGRENPASLVGSKRKFCGKQDGAAMHYLESTFKSTYSAKDVAHLRLRIQELELDYRHAKEALEMAQAQAGTGLPDTFYSPIFQASWKARTEIRKKIFCSLNRTGNALCAWHDSRRERRVYPPRNAPHGYLNCGCSFEEALFEDSLSRHNVGSCYPGEAVRMDPALRNPLLKLLQIRYGYKDGDFEHDPLTEQWHEGQSPESWEQKLIQPIKW